MMKLIGSLMIAGASFAAGAYFSGNFRKRLVQLRAAENMISQLILYFRCSGFDVYEACEKMAADDAFSSLDFLGNVKPADDERFSEIWKKAISAQKSCMLDDEEKELIMSVGDFLGKTDLEGQLMSLGGIRDRLRECIEKAVPETEKKVKLYSSLSVLCGTALLLFLI